MRRNRLTFKVTVPHREGVTIADWKMYILCAIRAWSGGSSPDDPLFDLWDEKITVVMMREEKK